MYLKYSVSHSPFYRINVRIFYSLNKRCHLYVVIEDVSIKSTPFEEAKIPIGLNLLY